MIKAVSTRRPNQAIPPTVTDPRPPTTRPLTHPVPCHAPPCPVPPCLAQSLPPAPPEAKRPPVNDKSRGSAKGRVCGVGRGEHHTLDCALGERQRYIKVAAEISGSQWSAD
ncbi:hypothetical protein E2C01_002498 [Portunus trituberculatus]|uniref:Uncharacterized protein n=1 Tax=Portunus trituberculatus TaxID=210409 RepID=A0A5B7CM27_PORTR|nr:hypothetical protein [Portunus trituberculatus]